MTVLVLKKLGAKVYGEKSAGVADSYGFFINENISLCMSRDSYEKDEHYNRGIISDFKNINNKFYPY